MESMHVYGVGTSGNIGKSVRTLMDQNYNKSKRSMGQQSFERRSEQATVNAEVRDVKLTLDSNRVSDISRPFITVKSDVRDVWAQVTDDVDHVSFLPESRPELVYNYPLNDEEIKGFIDAGLYSNPRFEKLLFSLLESEQFEIVRDVDFQTIEVIQEGESVPVILFQNMGMVNQKMDVNSIEDYTTFDLAVERSIDMALQLESEGISTDALMGADLEEEETIEEVVVDIDDAFDTGLVEREEDVSEYAVDEDEIISRLEQEIDISDQIDMTQLFGQTSEEERIRQMREAIKRGESIDSSEFDDIEAFDDIDQLLDSMDGVESVVEEDSLVPLAGDFEDDSHEERLRQGRGAAMRGESVDDIDYDSLDESFGFDDDVEDSIGFDDISGDVEIDDEMEFELDLDDIEDELEF